MRTNSSPKLVLTTLPPVERQVVSGHVAEYAGRLSSTWWRCVRLHGADADGTRRLQRYILGLALVALLAQSEKFLREGCLLVPAGENGAETKLVERTGKRTALNLTEGEVLEFAKAAAVDFGVGAAWTAEFSKDSVKQEATEKTKKAK